MNLYLDDNIAGDKLAVLLRKAGRRATLPADVSMSGSTDARHLAFAIRNSLVTLTCDHNDFTDLHEVIMAAKGGHPGILIVRMDNDPTRDMSDRGIVNAIAKLEKSGAPLANFVHVLNQWR